MFWPAVTQHNGLPGTGGEDFKRHTIDGNHLWLGKIHHGRNLYKCVVG